MSGVVEEFVQNLWITLTKTVTFLGDVCRELGDFYSQWCTVLSFLCFCRKGI